MHLGLSTDLTQSKTEAKPVEQVEAVDLQDLSNVKISIEREEIYHPPELVATIQKIDQLKAQIKTAKSNLNELLIENNKSIKVWDALYPQAYTKQPLAYNCLQGLNRIVNPLNPQTGLLKALRARDIVDNFDQRMQWGLGLGIGGIVLSFFSSLAPPLLPIPLLDTCAKLALPILSAVVGNGIIDAIDLYKAISKKQLSLGHAEIAARLKKANADKHTSLCILTSPVQIAKSLFFDLPRGLIRAISGADREANESIKEIKNGVEHLLTNLPNTAPHHRQELLKESLNPVRTNLKLAQEKIDSLSKTILVLNEDLDSSELSLKSLKDYPLRFQEELKSFLLRRRDRVLINVANGEIASNKSGELIDIEELASNRMPLVLFDEYAPLSDSSAWTTSTILNLISNEPGQKLLKDFTNQIPNDKFRLYAQNVLEKFSKIEAGLF